MNPQETKKILALHRPETDDVHPAQFAAALEAVRRDPELRQWHQTHSVFQAAVREKFRAIEVPAGLKQSILDGRKIVRPKTGWRAPVWLGMAAAVLLLGLAGTVWFKPAPPDEFDIYRSRMIGTALREYRMDIVSNDPGEVRRFLALNNAPADYRLPDRLEPFQILGAGLLRWQDQPVSMVCFDAGDQEMLFLFIVHRDALKSPPPPAPVVERVNKLLTAGWTSADHAYLLAGPEGADWTESLARRF